MQLIYIKHQNHEFKRYLETKTMGENGEVIKQTKYPK